MINKNTRSWYQISEKLGLGLGGRDFGATDVATDVASLL